MKIKLFLTSALLILTNLSYGLDVVYCPATIQCTKKDDVKSCVASSGISGPLHPAGTVQDTIYSFSSVSSIYEYPKPVTTGFTTLCFYTTKNGKVSHQIYLSDSKDSRALIDDADANKWTAVDWSASCSSLNPTECPMFIYNS